MFHAPATSPSVNTQLPPSDLQLSRVGTPQVCDGTRGFLFVMLHDLQDPTASSSGRSRILTASRLRWAVRDNRLAEHESPKDYLGSFPELHLRHNTTLTL